MKIKFTFLFLFCVSFIFAQNKLFQNSISEKNLNSNQKISRGLAETYSITRYYQQNAFDLNSGFELTLPNNKVIKAKFLRKFIYTNKSESVVYTVQNEVNSELVLSKVDNIITGMYSSEDGEKAIFHQTDVSVFAISMLNESSLISRDSEEVPLFDEADIINKTNPDICLPAATICPATTIDVMVVFTPQAKTAWGGIAQSKSFIATAMTNFNISLLNSGVSNVTINLVYSEEIAYVESGVIGTDLTRFRTENDTYMDTVATLRASYGADLCALVTSTPTNTCGLGYVNNNNTNYSPNSGFCVGLYNCVVSNYTLAHELGHNMGLQHDWFVNNSTNPCEHHHGYTNKTAITLGATSTAAQRWRTIMAYNDECTSAGISCTRINRWSNPLINYNTEPTGIAIGNVKPSDEAFGFARFACVVSQFMPTKTLALTENIGSGDFTVFPNPAKDEINIQIKNSQNYTFKISNLAGQYLLKSKGNKIDLKGLSTGEYILSVYDAGKTLVGSKKFIVK